MNGISAVVLNVPFEHADTVIKNATNPVGWVLKRFNTEDAYSHKGGNIHGKHFHAVIVGISLGW